MLWASPGGGPLYLRYVNGWHSARRAMCCNRSIQFVVQGRFTVLRPHRCRCRMCSHRDAVACTSTVLNQQPPGRARPNNPWRHHSIALLPPSTPDGRHRRETNLRAQCQHAATNAPAASWEGKCSAATCRMRVCSRVDARVGEQSDRRIRVASTRRRNRHKPVQSATRSDAAQRQRALFKMQDGTSDSCIASARQVRAE